ncbi:hypothetical protein V6N13_125122 [Hibiscus sabdariffa]
MDRSSTKESELTAKKLKKPGSSYCDSSEYIPVPPILTQFMPVSVGNDLEDVSVVEARIILLENVLRILTGTPQLWHLHSFQEIKDIPPELAVKLLSLVSNFVE